MANKNSEDLRDPSLGLNPYGSYKRTGDGVVPVPKKRPAIVPRRRNDPILSVPPVVAANAKKNKVKIEAASAPKKKFSGNWVGATPTEMQARGGARLKETPMQRMLRRQRERGVASK